jgi:hypothetical protein
MNLNNLLSDEVMYSPRAVLINQIAAVAVLVAFVTALWINIGLPPTVIVGGSAIIGFFFWRATNLRRAIEPRTTAILFLLTVAALHVHMFEEHAGLFGPAMSRLFDVPLPEERFMRIFVFAGPAIYYLTAIGLLLRIPFAAFVSWFIFIGPGLAEFTHFIFPLLTPAIEPGNIAVVSAVINGEMLTGLPNYSLSATGSYYFPGMYTAILPMIPGAFAVWWLMKMRRQSASGAARLEG